MLTRTENIEGFHLKVSEVEKEIYAEFERTEEQPLVEMMQQHFEEAIRQHTGIKFDNKAMWQKIEDGLNKWFREICTERLLDPEVVCRAREAMIHKLRDHLIKAIRDFLRANTKRLQRGAG